MISRFHFFTQTERSVFYEGFKSLLENDYWKIFPEFIELVKKLNDELNKIDCDCGTCQEYWTLEDKAKLEQIKKELKI